ncbi:MAG TPA: CAP domain-containing protein [Labilithrix sp.]|nr:CAP domain-containing protein [Labilithrix sp.]
MPAAPPPARPADPYPSDPLVKYNVERVNAYRAQKRLPPLLYDARISAFARRGSEQLSRDHVAHAHFAKNVQGAPGFGSRSAENQGDPSGVPALDNNASRNGKMQIDVMLKLMMDEGPGGGHYDNMMNPRFRRIGIGLVYAGGRLYMTNDFSD